MELQVNHALVVGKPSSANVVVVLQLSQDLDGFDLAGLKADQGWVAFASRVAGQSPDGSSLPPPLVVVKAAGRWVRIAPSWQAIPHVVGVRILLRSAAAAAAGLQTVENGLLSGELKKRRQVSKPS